MAMVTGWTGRAACALQAAMRMSNDAFAARLGISVRTVAGWHQKPDMRPQPENQQILDAALAGATQGVRDRFAVLAGEPAHPTVTAEGQNAVAADAEHRLLTDKNVSASISRLDHLVS